MNRKLLLVMEEYDRLPWVEPEPQILRFTPDSVVYWVGEPQLVGSIPPRQDLRVGDEARILAEALRSSGGRSAFAQAMTEPLRMCRDYESVGRRLFNVQELPPRAPFIRDVQMSDEDLAALQEQIDHILEDPDFSIITSHEAERNQ